MAWAHQKTRWAVYLRDDLKCGYCGYTMQQAVENPDGDVFLTLDHVVARELGGTHSPSNLVTCCYQCNISKGDNSLKRFCELQGWNYNTVKSRIVRQRQRGLDRFRLAAGVLLGGVPGVPRAKMVQLHDWLCRQQWMNEADQQQWAFYFDFDEQQDLWCPTCMRPMQQEATPF